VALYDDVAANYDTSRGGETRGDDFAAALLEWLPVGEGPVLEVGVGTGVVALGLRRRGCPVLGVDLSSAMLARAAARLGPRVAQGDARRLPVRNGSVAHAVSVWVVHSVDPPEALFAEVARIVRPGGRYVVALTNRAPADDQLERIIAAMAARAEAARPGLRRSIGIDEVLELGAGAGFVGERSVLRSRSWTTSAAEQVRWINDRVWPLLVGLDDARFREVTRPAFAELAALPDGPIVRTAENDIAILTRR
jgi:SAM-dependent methyltransferase